ncbi:hypothetical protein Tco_0095600, partial [Tanacetum coccineum]
AGKQLKDGVVGLIDFGNERGCVGGDMNGCGLGDVDVGVKGGIIRLLFRDGGLPLPSFLLYAVGNVSEERDGAASKVEPVGVDTWSFDLSSISLARPIACVMVWGRRMKSSCWIS